MLLLIFFISSALYNSGCYTFKEEGLHPRGGLENGSEAGNNSYAYYNFLANQAKENARLSKDVIEQKIQKSAAFKSLEEGASTSKHALKNVFDFVKSSEGQELIASQVREHVKQGVRHIKNAGTALDENASTFLRGQNLDASGLPLEMMAPDVQGGAYRLYQNIKNYFSPQSIKSAAAEAAGKTQNGARLIQNFGGVNAQLLDHRNEAFVASDQLTREEKRNLLIQQFEESNQKNKEKLDKLSAQNTIFDQKMRPYAANVLQLRTKVKFLESLVEQGLGTPEELKQLFTNRIMLKNLEKNGCGYSSADRKEDESRAAVKGLNIPSTMFKKVVEGVHNDAQSIKDWGNQELALPSQESIQNGIVKVKDGLVHVVNVLNENYDQDGPPEVDAYDALNERLPKIIDAAKVVGTAVKSTSKALVSAGQTHVDDLTPTNQTIINAVMETPNIVKHTVGAVKSMASGAQTIGKILAGGMKEPQNKPKKHPLAYVQPTLTPEQSKSKHPLAYVQSTLTPEQMVRAQELQSMGAAARNKVDAMAEVDAVRKQAIDRTFAK